MNYRTAIVSYIDILGFKSFVASATVDDILDVLNAKYSLALHFPEISRDVDQNNFTGYTVSFSDLIVNVTPLGSTQPLHGLFDSIATLGFRQFMLATQGIFVRGGIAMGDIYVDSRTIFGPALIQAYHIEQASAKWPIIAIDPELIRAMKGMARRYYAERRRSGGSEGWLAKRFLEQLARFFKKTEKGIYFLDYLSSLEFHDSATGDLYFYLQGHRDSVKKAYAHYAHWKYSFVAQYHDSYCQKCFPDEPTLLIGPLP